MEPRSIAESAGTFESLCISVLQERGYKDDTELANWRNPDAADFVGVHAKSNQKLLAEFKLTLSSRVRPTFINQAISSLLAKKTFIDDAELLLVVSVPLPEVWMNTAHQAGIDLIWDLPMLLSEASHTSVFPKLQSFLSDVGVADLGALGTAVTTVEQLDSSEPPKARGADICAEINEVSSGQQGAVDFERLCKEALLHLFGDQFGAWHTQSRSDDGLHRRDFLVRLQPRHDFWISLSHDFRSRYIVFEFKNYQSQIGQDQIYSTEKYLFTTALRSVCFIIARNGASENAYQAAAGALRETGKLIIIISGADLCEMLKATDRGEEPEILMHRLLDDVLTKMLR